ncbi:MAG: lactate utilization protein [Chitinophagaceae bacterium]
MADSSSKEVILKKIRKALIESTPLPFPLSEGSHSLYQPSQKELEIQFAEEFSKLQGRFAFCLNHAELCQQLNALIAEKNWSKIYCVEPILKSILTTGGFTGLSTETSLVDCDASITTCESLVARTGSMILTAASQSGRTVSVYAPVHICIAYTKQLVYDIKDALQSIKEKYGANIPSLISLASGPSRTADIEKTLVTGVHGPKEVYLFLIDTSS